MFYMLSRFSQATPNDVVSCSHNQPQCSSKLILLWLYAGILKIYIIKHNFSDRKKGLSSNALKMHHVRRSTPSTLGTLFISLPHNVPVRHIKKWTTLTICLMKPHFTSKILPLYNFFVVTWFLKSWFSLLMRNHYVNRLYILRMVCGCDKKTEEMDE